MARHNRTPGFHPSANPKYIEAMRELRRSNAAQPHTPKPQRGTRSEREREAIRDQKRDMP